jgi:hypothetical protein
LNVNEDDDEASTKVDGFRRHLRKNKSTFSANAIPTDANSKQKSVPIKGGKKRSKDFLSPTEPEQKLLFCPRSYGIKFIIYIPRKKFTCT